jgi:hypothetical protein
VVARLQAWGFARKAQTEIKFIAARLAREYPPENEGLSPRILALRDGYSQQSRLLLIALCGAAICVCFSRARTSRVSAHRAIAGTSQEMDIRIALGAGRGRLVRQLMTRVS